MDAYVHDVLERNALVMRDRAAPHARHRHDVLAQRATDRRIRGASSVHAMFVMLRRRMSHVRVPAGAGGLT